METTEIVKLVLEFIEKTGNAIFTSGFQMATKYIIANAVGNLVGAGISVVVFSVCLNNIYKITPYILDDKLPYPNAKQTINFFLCLLFGFLSIFAFFGFSVIESTKMLIAPEWYAILKIISVVK